MLPPAKNRNEKKTFRRNAPDFETGLHTPMTESCSCQPAGNKNEGEEIKCNPKIKGESSTNSIVVVK